MNVLADGLGWEMAELAFQLRHYRDRRRLGQIHPSAARPRAPPQQATATRICSGYKVPWTSEKHLRMPPEDPLIMKKPCQHSADKFPSAEKRCNIKRISYGMRRN